MDKMKFETLDMTAQNIDRIAALFPNCVTEMRDENGKVKRGINFEVLKQMLSSDVVDGDECYEFTWVGKKASIAEANSPIRKTLRPCPEESKDWDTTKNLYIEGKNLDILKLLQESYLEKIKMIYIDPPYNTGNNIIYPNDYRKSLGEYEIDINITDSVGNKLFKNTSANGRFHSDWCSIIYSVLLLSRNLLKSDGYIAIAIDDNELYSLKLISDEVFGETNYIGTIVTRSNPQGRNKDNIDPVHEYHLLYAKNILSLSGLKINNKKTGYKYLLRSGTNSRKRERPYRFYPMLVKNGKIYMITKDEYNKIYAIHKAFDQKHLDELRDKYENLGYQFILPIAKNGEEKVWQREFDRVNKEYETYIFENGQIKIPEADQRTPTSLWIDDKYSNVSNGTNKLKELFDNRIPFDFSKSIFTIKDLISLNTTNDDIVLDFFSGSATTAQAVMELNFEDNSKRSYILVQVPEIISEDNESSKMGYKNICEIGKERIRRAGEKIKAENGLAAQNLEIGFRVLKLADSNMKDVYYAADDYKQADLFDMVSNIKDDRTDLDLLFGCLIDWGLPLSMPYTSEKVEGCTVHTYNDGDLIACFEANIPESVVKEIASRKPLRAVFRDSSFANSPAKINVFEIFKLYMPEDADDISKRVRVI